MLNSYRNNIGRANINILKASGVGVITAATINIITMAYLYFFLKERTSSMPNFVNRKLKTGI